MSVKLLGHRIHPMLIAFPIGLLAGSVASDIAFLATGGERWADISFWNLAAGIASGLLAAPFGSLDWLNIPAGTRAKRIGLWHGVTAVLSVILFAISLWLRWEVPAKPTLEAVIVSFAAATVLGVAAWLGGELVQRLGVGVDRGAHWNSPSSLTGTTANDSNVAARSWSKR